ncbi:hypothetical protein B296_00017276 [Ensete ventricosum]|uniref:Uncharacterized protein n=1 Tax=Ensete ventricosum TaxID=4639 RepID=A0A426ZZZ6_ENSVE|nr:hypothetical protein B296_00017276 [Ensete ventricosum]
MPEAIGLVGGLVFTQSRRVCSWSSCTASKTGGDRQRIEERDHWSVTSEECHQRDRGEEQKQGRSKSFLRKKRRSVTSEEWSLVKVTQEEAATTSGERRIEGYRGDRCRSGVGSWPTQREGGNNNDAAGRGRRGWLENKAIVGEEAPPVDAAAMRERAREVGATPFSCRRKLWWEQAPNDASNGSNLTMGVGTVNSNAEAAVNSGTPEWSREIGKAVSSGAAVKERDGDRMKASPLQDGRMDSNDKGSCGGGGKQ